MTKKKLFTEKETDKLCSRVISKLKFGKDLRVILFEKEEYVMFNKNGFQKFVTLLSKEMLKKSFED